MPKRKKPRIEVFLSYHHKDRKIAGRLKHFLEGLGLIVFLAHEDLNPAEEYQKEIIKHLSTCQVFIPILTRNFVISNWTDQETGIAYERGKEILPVSIYTLPYGFIAKFQCHRLKPRDFENSCIGLVRGLSQKSTKIRDRICSTIIRNFANSHNFAQANYGSQLLLEFEKLTRQELYFIMKSARMNDQVFRSYMSQGNLSELYERNSHLISTKLWNSVRAKFVF